MGRAGVPIDVQAVGLVVDDVGICAQGVKHRLGNVPARTVGAVQTHLDPLEGVDAQGNQVAHIAVPARHIVHGAADAVPVGKGQLGPVLVKNVQLAVQIVLHQLQGLLVHLFATVVDQLDAVVVVGVVAGRDHDAAVEVIHPGDVGHAGGGGDVQQVGIRPRSHQSADQRILEHIAGAAGVLADHDARRIVVAIALAQHAVVPAEETADLVGVVCGEFNVGFTTEAVGAKVFSHY